MKESFRLPAIQMPCGFRDIGGGIMAGAGRQAIGPIALIMEAPGSPRDIITTEDGTTGDLDIGIDDF